MSFSLNKWQCMIFLLQITVLSSEPQKLVDYMMALVPLIYISRICYICDVRSVQYRDLSIKSRWFVFARFAWFARRHVARGTWRRPTRDRHHHRSPGSVHRTVPPLSRLVKPFGRHVPKSLDTQTDRQTRPGQLFSPPTNGIFQM